MFDGSRRRARRVHGLTPRESMVEIVLKSFIGGGDGEVEEPIDGGCVSLMIGELSAS